MVYFSKKQLASVAYTKSEADAKFAKLASPNNFTGANTFSQTINSNKGFETTSNNADILKMDLQAQKTANIVYKQSQTGYLNYCNFKYLFTANDTTYTKLLEFEFRPNSNEGVFINTDLNNITFNNKEIKGVASPTTNTSVANKQYVDNIVKYVEKVGGLSFTRQPLNQTTGQQVIKYYCNINYSTINIPNGKHIISCYSKTIPAQGAHLVITFFPVYQANQCLIEIYQYNSSTDITTNLNGATYCFTYLNV